MNIDLHIERLVLDGLPIAWHERPQLQAAVEAELTRLLTESGLSRQGNIAVREIQAAPIQLSAEHDPAQIGRQIAQSVYGGLNR